MSSKSSPRGAASLKTSDRKALKDLVLGPEYELSLVFCKDALSQRLNRTYRGKDKPTNVLAFPLTKTSGEIFINTQRLGEFSALELYIHALLHLKGMQHGAKMESEEKKLLKLYNGAPHRSRDRHRDSQHQGRHRRGGSGRSASRT